MSPRRSVLASIAAGCCVAASVVAGGYAAGGAMPFEGWPAALFSSAGAAEVALAPAGRAAAPVVTLPAAVRESEPRTEVIPLEDDAAADRSGPDPSGTTRRPVRRLPDSRSRSRSRSPKTDDAEPDTSPTTAPPATTPPTPASPPASTAAPAAESGPVQPAATVPPTTRRVTLGEVTSAFSSASDSESGQPELHVQMAVAGASETVESQTVALRLKITPTDIRALMRSAAAINASHIALETEVDVVDATVASVGEPACVDGTCLRVQMKFAQDTRVDPTEEPEVQMLEDGDAISNRVRVVVQIEAEDLGTHGNQPDAEPAPDAGAPSVLSLPMPGATDPESPSAPSTDTTTVTLPGADSAPGTPDAPAVQIEAQLEAVDTPAPETPAPADTTTAGVSAPAASPADDCPPAQA